MTAISVRDQNLPPPQGYLERGRDQTKPLQLPCAPGTGTQTSSLMQLNGGTVHAAPTTTVPGGTSPFLEGHGGQVRSPASPTRPNLAETLPPTRANPEGRKAKHRPWTLASGRPGQAQAQLSQLRGPGRWLSDSGPQPPTGPRWPLTAGLGSSTRSARCLHPPPLMASYVCETNTTIRRMWMKAGNV